FLLEFNSLRPNRPKYNLALTTSREIASEHATQRQFDPPGKGNTISLPFLSYSCTAPFPAARP
ncbi:MAG: hypothetical protein ACC707_14435, partial [Thiohalomonadales bacterium]